MANHTCVGGDEDCWACHPPERQDFWSLPAPDAYWREMRRRTYELVGELITACRGLKPDEPGFFAEIYNIRKERDTNDR